MIDDIKLVAKSRDRAAEFLRTANARRRRVDARELQYTLGILLSGFLQLMLYFRFLWTAGERDGNPFNVFTHNINIALAGLSFLPVLAAVRRGDLAQRIAAIPFAIIPLGVLVHYTRWALALLDELP